MVNEGVLTKYWREKDVAHVFGEVKNTGGYF